MTANKSKILGEPFSTASQRLVKDILFKLATDANQKCFRCGGDLDRKSLSIEHKEDWMDSVNPKEAFFDLNNIAFSHAICNSEAMHKKRTKPCPTYGAYKRGCRCDLCVPFMKERRRVEQRNYREKNPDKRRKCKPYDPQERRDRYEKYGV